MVIYLMIRFRGHHLICLHFFHGEGYSPDFISNLRDTLALVQRDGVEVCSGPDDICFRCPSLKDAVCSYKEGADAEVLEMDRLALELLGVGPGMEVSWDGLRKRLPEIFNTWHETCCIVCGWKRACEKNDCWKEIKNVLSS